ncbi:MAG: FAD-dependent oxidoreductase, partial [Chloroflexi bacterium]|nr:FAD-dependent oxidoreductase [Chloroflexota bacterium]
MPDENEKRILILGAGFAGLYTALHLEKLLGPGTPAQITLVDRNHYHLFTPMLHEAATGMIPTGLLLAPIRRILHGRRIRFLRARVDAIDLAARQVTVCCAQIPYDILVIALGSVTNFYGLESVREQAFEFKNAEDADRLRCHVINCFEAATREPDPHRRRALLTFVVVGGGCTGVEIVTELDEFLEHLRQEQYADLDPAELHTVLVEALGSVLPQMGPSLAQSA